MTGSAVATEEIMGGTCSSYMGTAQWPMTYIEN